MFSLFFLVTSTFYLDGHRLFYLQRTLLGCVSLLITVSISPGTPSFCKIILFLQYFACIFKPLFHFFGSLLLLCCYVLVFLCLTSASVIFLSLLTFILPSKLHVIFSASSVVLFPIGPIFLWCFLDLISHISGAQDPHVTSSNCPGTTVLESD